MKNILIVEDNEAVRKHLCQLVKAVSKDVCIYEFSDTEGVYEFLFGCDIDLFVVDIILYKDVPGDVSGLKLMENVRKLPKYEFTPVVFVTSLYDEALYAYSQLHSYSYVEKPFDDEQVKNVIAGALRFPKVEREDKVLHFRMDGTFYVVNASEVLYIESVEHKVYIHKVDKKCMKVPYKSFDRLLEESEQACLVRCNRNVMINPMHIQYIDWSNGCLLLKGMTETINIGRVYRSRIRKVSDDL